MEPKHYFITSGTVFFIMALLRLQSILYMISEFESLGNIVTYASLSVGFLIPFALGIWAYWLFFKSDRKQQD